MKSTAKFMMAFLVIGLATTIPFIFSPPTEAADDWVSPTGHNDPETAWSNEANVYNDDDCVSWSTNLVGDSWKYLELTHAALDSDKIRAMHQNPGAWWEIDVYYDSGWHNIHAGTWSTGSFVEFAIGSTESVTAMRFRQDSNDNLCEADFNQVAAPPANTTPTVNIYNVTGSTTDVTPGIDFNYTDDDLVATCHTLYNGTSYGSNSSTVNATQTTISSNTTLTVGQDYNVTAICSDGTLQGTSASITLSVVDTTAPGITITSPTNTTYISTSIGLAWSANESLDTCIFELNGVNRTIGCYDFDKILSFPSPYPVANGITTVNGTHLWITDGIAENFTKVWANNGSQIFDRKMTGFPIPTQPLELTTVNGSDFWTTSSIRDEVFKFNETANMTGNFDTGGFGSDLPRGITTVNGSVFWVADVADDLVYKVDSSGNYLANFSTNTSNPFGLETIDGNIFWIGDPVSKVVYEVQPNETDGSHTLLRNYSTVGIVGDADDIAMYDNLSMFIIDATGDEIVEVGFQNVTLTFQGGQSVVNIYANDTAGNWGHAKVVLTVGDTCSCPSIQAGNPVDCSENCDIGACDADGQDVTIAGTGHITVSGDVTNYGRLLTAGTDADNKCIILYAGGGFK